MGIDVNGCNYRQRGECWPIGASHARHNQKVHAVSEPTELELTPPYRFYPHVLRTYK